MWGKVLGASFGFMFGRVGGLIFGLCVGHLYDRRLRQNFDQKGGFGRYFNQVERIKARQAIFFHATFSVMGNIAKANGRVSEIHIQIASQLMNQLGLSAAQKKEAQAAYREGKSPGFGLNEVLAEFKSSVFGRRELMQMFLEVQIQAAFSDGSLHADEKKLLHVVGKQLGLTEAQVETIIQRWQVEFRFHQQNKQGSSSGGSYQSSLADAYKILGISESSSQAEIKQAYKKLMFKHHPDKLVAKGLPPEMMEVAKRKTQDIQAAYEMLKQKAA